jgi:signal transduction histidine kinase
MSSLGQLVAGIAHEINNPISFIYGNLTYVNEYAENLLNLVKLYQECYPNSSPKIQTSEKEIELDFIQEDLPKILSSMKIGVDRIREIVLSLRNFSRLDEAEMKWVDVHEGIDNTLLILSHRLKAKPSKLPDIQVVKDYSNLPKVQCYPGQLNQVFMNILTNAIESIDDYNKQRKFEDIKKYPSTIWICTDVVEMKDVMILIGDNGAGMTPEVNRRLFDPFFTTKPVGSGTGLGMSISYKIIVEQHGGQLQCISAPGQGAVFLIQIPIQQKRSM